MKKQEVKTVWFAAKNYGWGYLLFILAWSWMNTTDFTRDKPYPPEWRWGGTPIFGKKK